MQSAKCKIVVFAPRMNKIIPRTNYNLVGRGLAPAAFRTNHNPVGTGLPDGPNRAAVIIVLIAFGNSGPSRTPVRLRYPAVATPDKAGLLPADRGTHCALASSATGSARARGPTNS